MRKDARLDVLDAEYGSTNLESGSYSCKRNEGWTERKDFCVRSESDWGEILFASVYASLNLTSSILHLSASHEPYA